MINLSEHKVSKVCGPSEGIAKGSEGIKSLNCMDRRDTGKLYPSNSDLRACPRCDAEFTPPPAVPHATLCPDCYQRRRDAEIRLGKVELQLKIERWHRRQEQAEFNRLVGIIRLANLKAKLAGQPEPIPDDMLDTMMRSDHEPERYPPRHRPPDSGSSLDPGQASQG